MHIYEYTNPLIIPNSKILKFLKTATNLVAKPKLIWPHLGAKPSLADVSLCVLRVCCVCVCVCACMCMQVWVFSGFSHVRLFVTPRTVAHQSPLSMGFSRQEYWSVLPFLFPGIFLTQGSTRLLHGRRILCHWATWEAPFILNSLDLNINISIEISVCLIIGHYIGAATYYKQHCKMCF